jgi:hypothetical protein
LHPQVFPYSYYASRKNFWRIKNLSKPLYLLKVLPKSAEKEKYQKTLANGAWFRYIIYLNKECNPKGE